MALVIGITASTHASVGADITGGVVLCAVGALGVVFALFPHRVNAVRQTLPGQGESPDWFIRLFGMLVTVFAVVCLVLLIVFST